MEISSGSKTFITGAPYRASDSSKFSAADLSLKIHISSAQIAYLISEKKNRRVLCLQPYQNPSSTKEQSATKFLESVLSEDELLKNLFSERQIGILTPDFTLLPKEFSDSHLSDQWKKKFTQQKNSSVLCADQIEDMNLEVDFVVPTQVINLLEDILKKYKLHHSITNQIRTLASRNQGRAVYCTVQSGFLQVIYLDSGQLMFANIFQYQSAEDFIYFLLAVYNQHHLDPENVKVVLLGEIMKDSAMFQLVYKYIRNIEFGKPSAQWKFDDDYPFPPHFYFSLLCS
ncbi:MAG TPA: DUF3822 family protein [Chitinophagales bacterium]|nr:DUF3822 family protein [Chitinophagales bacterium]